MRNSLETLEVNSRQLEEVLRRAEQALDDKDATFIRRVFESYLYVSDLVEDKNTSIRRLRELFFGKRTEKTKVVLARHADKATAPALSAPSDAALDSAGVSATAETIAPTVTPVDATLVQPRDPFPAAEPEKAATGSAKHDWL